MYGTASFGVTLWMYICFSSLRLSRDCVTLMISEQKSSWSISGKRREGDSPSFAATQDKCGRVAFLCRNIGSMRPSRPPLPQHRINVGDSPSFAATQDKCGRVALLCRNTGSMWASRPHSYRDLLYSQSAIAQTSPPSGISLYISLNISYWR